jgi:hypothetical protein
VIPPSSRFRFQMSTDRRGPTRAAAAVRAAQRHHTSERATTLARDRSQRPPSQRNIPEPWSMLHQCRNHVSRRGCDSSPTALPRRTDPRCPRAGTPGISRDTASRRDSRHP